MDSAYDAQEARSLALVRILADSGVIAHQTMHCGGPTGSPSECCCLNCCSGGSSACCGYTSCCEVQDAGYMGPTYSPGRVYVVGNIFNHIEPYLLTPETSFGQAVHIGNQVQADVVNNTIVGCSQGITIGATHSTGECPPGGDGSTDQGKTRNTRVRIINNIILDTVDDGDNDSHVRVSTGPYPGDTTVPSTLTQSDFDYNLHFEQPPRTLYVKLPNDLSNVCLSLACLREYVDDEHLLDWAMHSVEELNPSLQAPADFDFRATPESDFGNRGRTDDPAYIDFTAAFSGLGFPSIYHDYTGATYTPTACSFGAFKSPD